MGYKIVFNHPDDAYRILDIAEACVKELGRISQEVLCASLCLDVLHDDASIGWDDLYKAKILREKEGYVLHLSDPKPIKKLSHDGFEWQHWFRTYRSKNNL